MRFRAIWEALSWGKIARRARGATACAGGNHIGHGSDSPNRTPDAQLNEHSDGVLDERFEGAQQGRTGRSIDHPVIA